MAGRNKSRIVQVLLLSLAASSSACHKSSGDSGLGDAAVQPNAKAPAVPKPGPTLADQTANMVQAVAAGKSQLPVQLKFQLTQRPKVGQAVDINLALISQIDATAAIIKVDGGDDLTLEPEGSEFNIPAAKAGAIYRQTVHVTPAAEGVLILGVSVSLKHDDVTDQQSFSVPVIADR